jgi:ribosomal 50S subunit-associated protein YjgA (DUF615 family)
MVELPNFMRRTRKDREVEPYLGDQITTMNANYVHELINANVKKASEFMQNLSNELGSMPTNQPLEVYAKPQPSSQEQPEPIPINDNVAKAYQTASKQMNDIAVQLRAAYDQVEAEALHSLAEYKKQVNNSIAVVEQIRDELQEDGSKILNQINEDADRIANMSVNIKNAISANMKSVPISGWTTTLPKKLD